MAEAHFVSYEKYSDSSTWTAIAGTAEYLVLCLGKGSAREVEAFVEEVEGDRGSFAGAGLGSRILGWQRTIHHG